MRFFYIVFFVFLGSFWSANAQILKTPLAGQVNVNKIDDKYDARVYNFEASEPDDNSDFIALQKIKAISHQQFPYKNTTSKKNNKTTGQTPMPVLLNGFKPDTLTATPPDNDAAISTNTHVGVNVYNSGITFLNTTNGQLISRKSLYSFSYAVGLNNTPTNQNNYRYDPKVIYDAEAKRFITVILNGINGYNNIIVGFSQTEDPTGTWNFYKFYGDYAADTTWFDYPTISLTHNNFFLSGNKLGFNTSWQSGFRKSVIYQIKKSDGYNAATQLNYKIWDSTNYNGRPIRNLFPVKGGMAINGPSQYFVSNRNFDIQNDTIFLIKIADTLGALNNAISVTPLISNLNYGVPPNGRQNDTGRYLSTNDGRILGAYLQDDEIQFTSSSVNTLNGAAGIYHGVISNISTAPSVIAQMISVDSLDFGYPNLSFAGKYFGKNTSIITFNYTGNNTYAGFGTVFYDGNQHSDLLKLKNGDSSIAVIGNPERWGDYSGSQLMGENGLANHVLSVGIYGKRNRGYGVWMADLQSPIPTGVMPVTNQNKTLSKLFPNPSSQYIKLQFELEKSAILQFYLFDIAGKMVDHLTDANCSEGKNEIQFNTASLTAGSYYLKAKEADGSEVLNKLFIKN